MMCVWRLSVAYIGPKSRTGKPRKTKIGTEVARVTRDSDNTFKVKGQGHQAALLTAVLARQAAVGVGTCWPWKTAAALPSARRRKALRRRGEGRGHIMAVARLQLVINQVACRRRIEEEERDRERKREEKVRRRETRRQEREERRRLQKLEVKRQEDERKMQRRIALEERKILVAQRKLETIRLLSELFARIKVIWCSSVDT